MSFYLQSENSIEEESGISWIVHLESVENISGAANRTNFRRFDNNDEQVDFTFSNVCGVNDGNDNTRSGGEVESPPEQSTELGSRLLIAFVFNAIFIFLVVGLFISIVLQLSKNWENKCDINLKIWCIVWISRFLVSIITRSIIMLVTRGYERPSPISLVVIINIVHLFGIAWWFYGIHVIYTDPPKETCRQNLSIALFLFWFQFIQIFVPIILPILICIFVLYLLHRNEAQAAKKSVPEKMLCKIKAIPFQEHIQNLKNENIDVNIFNENQVKIENSVPSVENYKVGKENTVSSEDETLNHRISITISNFCPICVQEIDENVVIRILPCDNRHIFHRECIDDWFKQNCVCPICRSDIVQILSNSQS
ncbi:hypothetical protein FG386_001412 [Cryptosporidium ryanae]|uniref:uncharacterized protein n=1 Tax=Cryptosporidium ryanae TaxID=515981 RepID=UPI003519E02D|nr:hypothetical protein FG386_001412 [Cryptosporidium ryanae]